MDQPRTGAENMALDEAILESVINKSSPPTIRFYSWEPSCVTIGYFQRAKETLDIDKIKEYKFDVVRRATGGRAILHLNNELTYSITAPLSEFSECKTVLETYLKINCGLAIGFRDYGIEVELAPDDKMDRFEPEALLSSIKYVSNNQVFRPQIKSGACFDTPAPYELVYKNRKIAGSAQTRRNDVLLQQGSIPFNMDYETMQNIFRLSSKSVKDLKDGTFPLKNIEADIKREGLSGYLVKGIAKALDIQLEDSSLTPIEIEKTFMLLEKKYLCNEWTFKR